ncbi:MAG: hypothetical protein M3Q98_09975 [Actinomycetota bacterium]|nr:hypothetical protein [Actinomycetota bacterium]
MTYDIPPLRQPQDTPPIRTQEDLCTQWRSMMGKLGFGQRYLWALMLDEDGYLLPGVVQIEQCPVAPDRAMIRTLLRSLRTVMKQDCTAGSLAFLWSRPGTAETRKTDIAWAAALIIEARRAKVQMWPVHLANDYDLRVFAPDELAA